jgi:uncharacterized protein YfiM (DUF2279 family)
MGALRDGSRLPGARAARRLGPVRSACRIPRRPLLAAAALLAFAAAATAGSGTAAAEPFLLPMDREGAWTAPDRQLHFGGSLAIAASLRVEGRTRSDALVLAVGVGIAKEVYDATFKPRRLGRGASRKDLIADLAGAAAGILLLAALDR